MIINAVGCPHSGTDILRSLLAGAGVRTRSGEPNLAFDRRLVDRRVPYDCYDFPEWVTKWIDESEMSGENDYMYREKDFFHDAWERFSIMYALEQRYPKLRFLIVLRDPREVIGDWFKGTTGPEVTIDTYRDTVLRISHSMWEQADLMKNKPIIMDYDLSHYLQPIFEMFKIENSLENIHKAQAFLKRSYTKTEMYEGDISEILFYQNKLRQWLIDAQENSSNEQHIKTGGK